MSALQFLREKAGVLVAGLIGFSLFLFVISDFFGRGRGQRLKQKKYYEIGQIGGEYISYQDYELRLQNLLEIYKLSGRTNVDETAKKYWLFFENEIVNDRTNTKYNNLVSKGLFITSKQAEFEKNLNGNTVDFSYILKNYAAVPDSSIRIFESDLEAYYAKHKENYKRTALRDIEYVTFDVIPSEDDIKQTEQWVNKTKEEFATAPEPVEFINLSADSRYVGFFIPLSSVPENLKDYVKKEDLTSVFGPYIQDGSYKLAKLIAVGDRPDSVHVRHILLSTGRTRTLDVAKHQADSLIKLIKSGTPFETLTMANSDDQGSAKIGGDLGWFPEGKMVLPFNNACFTGKKGDIKIAESTFGIHIIEILAQSKDTRKYNIGYIDRKITSGSLTNQKAYSEASQFAGTNDTYEKFSKTIATKGLNKRVANSVAPQQKTLPGLDNPRSLIMALFQAEKVKIILDNSQQAVFEVGEKYVVAYCTKVQEDGIAAQKDIENDIRFSLLKDKKAELISAEFNKNSVSGKTIDDIARTMGLTVQEA